MRCPACNKNLGVLVMQETFSCPECNARLKLNTISSLLLSLVISYLLVLSVLAFVQPTDATITITLVVTSAVGIIVGILCQSATLIEE
jgi:hypothetical protein